MKSFGQKAWMLPLRSLAAAIIMTYIEENEAKLSEL